MLNLHALIDSLNASGIQVAWARELHSASQPDKASVFVPSFRLLVLSASASVPVLKEACRVTLTLAGAPDPDPLPH